MLTPKKILERRGSARIVESLPFKIGHDGYEIEAETVNLSSTGAMCVTDRKLPLMTQLNIGLSLPSANGNGKTGLRQIKIKGVVVRSEKNPLADKYSIGIFFSDMKEADRKILDEFIERRLRQ